MDSLQIIGNALDKANKSGVYSLNESATLFAALQHLAGELNKKETPPSPKECEPKDGGVAEKSGDGKHTPIPPVGPK